MNLPPSNPPLLSVVSVKLKNEEAACTHKFLCYEPLHDLELLKRYVEEAKQEFKSSVDEVKVTTTIQWE